MPAPKKSMRPKARSSAPTKSLRPKSRPEMIGSTSSGSTRGIDPMENYSAEDFKKLTGGQSTKETQKFAMGGEIRGCKSGQMAGKGYSGNY